MPPYGQPHPAADATAAAGNPATALPFNPVLALARRAALESQATITTAVWRPNVIDRAIVMSIRAWVDAVRRDAPPSQAVRASFEVMGEVEVASLLHAVMTAIGFGVRRPLAIGPLAAREFTDDERMILGAIASAGHGPAIDPTLALRPVLTVAACRACRPLLRELARALDQSGWRVNAG